MEDSHTECVLTAETPSDAFGILLRHNTANKADNNVINLIFFDAGLSCRALGFDCGGSCNVCSGRGGYPCVILKYVKGHLKQTMVLPEPPMTYGIQDVVIGSDILAQFMPDPPESLDSRFLQQLARGCAYTTEAFQLAVRQLNNYSGVARQLAGNRRDYNFSDALLYELPLLAMGLAGEAGEVANIAKKYVRNTLTGGVPPELEKIVDEIGDVLWYSAAILDLLEYDIEEAMLMNIAKLEARVRRGQLTSENRGEVDLGREGV